MSIPVALTIAGSDSSAGAGIQADLKTFAALGIYGASVITALTAQNTKGVFAIHDVPADFIAAQMDAVFSDLNVAAVKIGMLGNTAAIEAVAGGLHRHRARNVVLDPVMVASTGADLLRADAMDALRKLIGRVNVFTPNLFEAAALLEGTMARDEGEMRAQAQKLRAFGAERYLRGSSGGSLKRWSEPGEPGVADLGAEAVLALVPRPGVVDRGAWSTSRSTRIAPR